MLIGEYANWPKYHDQLNRQVRVIPFNHNYRSYSAWKYWTYQLTLPPLGLEVPPFMEPVGAGARLLTRITVLYWL